jgi:hypothetical protein
VFNDETEAALSFFLREKEQVRTRIAQRIAVICLLSAPATAMAGLIPKARTYRQMDGFDNGYKEKVQPDGTWRIVTGSRPTIDGVGFAQEIALYRAAELTVASGHSFFQVLDAVGTKTFFGGRRTLFSSKNQILSPAKDETPVRETMKLIIRMSDQSGPFTDCRSKEVSNCITVDAAPLIERIGPTLSK